MKACSQQARRIRSHPSEAWAIDSGPDPGGDGLAHFPRYQDSTAKKSIDGQNSQLRHDCIFQANSWIQSDGWGLSEPGAKLRSPTAIVGWLEYVV